MHWAQIHSEDKLLRDLGPIFGASPQSDSEFLNAWNIDIVALAYAYGSSASMIGLLRRCCCCWVIGFIR